MARAGAAYPQADPGAGGLPQTAVAIGAPRATVVRALELCRRTGADAVALGPRRIARAGDLARAVEWGLGDCGAGDLAWSGLPAVDVRTSEIQARRLLIAGAPLVIVRRGRQAVGVIDRESAGVAAPRWAVRARLEDVATPEAEVRLEVLRRAGALGERMGLATWAVGGVVRDLLLGRAAPDIDVVVEGDGIAFARRLAAEIGGRVSAHRDFGTASVSGGRSADGRSLGRIDVASARAERYESPGALPIVRAATIEEDLARRDFSVNAMAVALAPTAFGELLDPFGGRRDLRERRLRPLSPVSFVEDPTRMFRAARYAGRLGFRLSAQGRAAIRVALGLAYPALSGQRLRAEIDLIAAERRSRQGFERVVSWRLLRLLDRSCRPSPRTPTRLRAAEALLARPWSTAIGIGPGEVALIALLVDQRRDVARRCLDRLAVRGEPRAALESAVASRSLARRLAVPSLRPSGVADALGRHSAPVLAAAWLLGRRRCRGRIEWFVETGHSVRPLLSGDDVAELGVPRGPRIGECLARLRRLRLDGIATSVADERAYVAGWAGGVGTAGASGDGSASRPKEA